MKGGIKTVRHVIETMAAYLAFGFFKMLPPESASALGGAILRRLGMRLGATRTARENITRAFPDKNAVEIESLLLDMWENLGRVIAEYPHLKSICETLEIVGGEHAVEEGAGIFIGGHIANWEVGTPGAAKLGIPMALVYRKPNNPWVDGLLRRARGIAASDHIAKGAAGARGIVSVLRQGGKVGMLVDQRLGEGLPIPFFGQPAFTAPAPAMFALKFGVPLYPVRIERLKGCRFRMTIFPSLAVRSTDGRDADIARVLTEINALLESWIRENPAHWLWTHRRWEKRGGDGGATPA